MKTTVDIINIILKAHLNSKYGIKCDSYSSTTSYMYEISYKMVWGGLYG